MCKVDFDFLPNLHVIVCSPLNRSLMTAYLTFKDHPNFENCRIMIEPDITEVLDKTSSIPKPIDDKLASYNKLFKQGIDIRFLQPLLDASQSIHMSSRDLFFL